MKFEEKQRNILEEKKKIEHENEIRKVFSNVNEKTGKFQKDEKAEKYLEI